MKRYIPLEPTEEENMLCLTTGFDAGGVNWWNGQNTAKGYYLYCTPVLEKENCLSDGTAYKTYTQQLGKGGKLLLKSVSRRSKKAEAEAERIATDKQGWLISEICKKYGLLVRQSEVGSAVQVVRGPENGQ